jgi:hypothetical protein
MGGLAARAAWPALAALLMLKGIHCP